MNLSDYTLVQTCSASPEQYDVFLGKRLVGYMRLRWGYFTVRYPDCCGEVIYAFNFAAKTPGYTTFSGSFGNEEDRQTHINAGLRVIHERYSNRSLLDKVLDYFRSLHRKHSESKKDKAIEQIFKKPLK